MHGTEEEQCIPVWRYVARILPAVEPALSYPSITFMSTKAPIHIINYVSCVYVHMKRMRSPFNNIPSQVGALPDHCPVA